LCFEVLQGGSSGWFSFLAASPGGARRRDKQPFFEIGFEHAPPARRNMDDGRPLALRNLSFERSASLVSTPGGFIIRKDTHSHLMS